MRSFAPAHAALNVLRAVRFLFHFTSFTDRTAAVALAAVRYYALISTGGLNDHALLTMMIRNSCTGVMTARFPLVRPSLKWSDFTPTSIPTIYSSRLSMPSCVMLPKIRVILYF